MSQQLCTNTDASAACQHQCHTTVASSRSGCVCSLLADQAEVHLGLSISILQASPERTCTNVPQHSCMGMLQLRTYHSSLALH